MSTTKKTPKLRFPEFSGEWEEKKLNDVGLITTGSTPSTSISEYYGGERLFISPVDIQGNRYINKTKTTLTELGFSKGRKVEKDSVCFVCIGSTIGKVAQLTEDSLTNQQINCITANNKNFNDFVYSLLELKASKIKLLAGEQALPQINKSDFSKLKFYLPSLQEQEKIASFLISIDTKIEQLIKKEELLKQYKKGVMQKIFSQKLRFKDEKGQDYPVWQEKKLGKLLKKNKTRNKSGQVDYVQSVSNKHGFVSQDEYFDGANISSKDTSNYFVIQKGNFAYNPSRINVGSLAYKSDSVTSIVSPLYVSFTAKGELLDGYLLPWFSNQSFIGQMRRAFEGSVRDTLSYEALSEMKLNLPCKKEQQRIANFLTSLDDKINLEKNKLEQAKLFKKSLLQRMFI